MSQTHVKEVKVEPIIVDKKPLVQIPQERCLTCGDINKALETLRERVKNANLTPLKHKASCLANKSEYDGLFGSILKGTYIPGSDIDFAVYMPPNFFQNLDKYVKSVLDGAYYMQKTSYGVVVYGEVAYVPVDMYYIYPSIARFHAFESDGALACVLGESERDSVRFIKTLAKDYGLYGDFGGVPGVAIEWAHVVARDEGVSVEKVLLWDYIPIKTLQGLLAGNAVGRTFYINQLGLYAVLRKDIPVPEKTAERKYARVVGYLAHEYGLAFEWASVREYLPISLVYIAYVNALKTVLGERAHWLARRVGVFGPLENNGYVLGLAVPKAGGKDGQGATIDRIYSSFPDLCSLETGTVRFEGGIVCSDEPVRYSDLRRAVIAVYNEFKKQLSVIYDRHITAKLI